MRQYVFVAGYDYDGKGITFKVIADHRKNNIIRANAAKEELRFHICDFKLGKIKKYVVTYPSGTKRVAVTETSSFDAITSSHYGTVLDAAGNPQTGFKDNQRTVMSILHVYELVQLIGLDDLGTLHEFSFFSHGWMGGPILVNSFDNRSQQVIVSGVGGAAPTTRIVPIAGTVRDPDDMDPRSGYDFTAPTMDSVRLGLFKAAFHPDGYIWIWGCAFPTSIHQFLNKVERNSAYSRTGVADNTIFTLKNLNADHRDFISSYSGGLLIPPASGDVDITFEMIKYIMCSANQNTYAFAAAYLTNIKTYAAPLGTYAEFDPHNATSLMNVSSSFTRHFNFYKTYLGLNSDPEGRRYLEYLPTMTCPRPAAPAVGP